MPKTNTNYNNTISYKIVCNDLNIKDLYVGHTTNFIKRKNHHKWSCSNINRCNLKVYQTIRNNGGWDNWNMIEIEKYPCNDSNEAKSRERYWLETLSASLNRQLPTRTNKEYYNLNKDKINEQKKDYYYNHKAEYKENYKNYYDLNKETIIKKVRLYSDLNKDKIKTKMSVYTRVNKDKIKERQSETIICECGSKFWKSNEKRHQTTLKHCEFIESKN